MVQRHLPDHEQAHAAAARLIAEVDANHDGQVDYSEFCAGVAGGKFPGMGGGATPAPAPPADTTAVENEAERKRRVAEDAKSVEREEELNEQDLIAIERELEAVAVRDAAEASREERIAAQLAAEAEREHQVLLHEEQELKEEQRELRRVYSHGAVPSDINDPNSLLSSQYQYEQDEELAEVRAEIAREKALIVTEKEVYAEKDARAHA